MKNCLGSLPGPVRLLFLIFALSLGSLAPGVALGQSARYARTAAEAPPIDVKIVVTNRIDVTNVVVYPVPSILLPAPVNRDAGFAAIPLVFSGPVPTPVTVSFEPLGGSGVLGTDFESPLPGPIVYPIGTISVPLSIPILNPPETDPETDIQFAIRVQFPGQFPIVLSPLVVLINAEPEDLADIRITQAAVPTQVMIDKKITVTVTAANLGPKAARDIRIQDLVPAGLTLDAHAAATGAYVPATGLWSIPALANGASTTLTLTLKPTTVGGTFTNVATRQASAPRDPDATNNRAEQVIQFQGVGACGVARLCAIFGGPPNTNAIVSLVGPVRVNGRANDLGFFCFTNLPAGEYDLTVAPANAASGIKTVTQKVTVDATGAPIDVVSPWLVIVGRLRLSTTNGVPLPGITVEAVAGAEKKQAVTDAQGEYRITGLGEKAYTLKPINLPAGLASAPPSIDIDLSLGTDPCPARADFVLRGRFTLTGIVRACFARGAPLPSTTLTLVGVDVTFTQTIRTGVDGRYRFTGLPPGRYTLTASHPTHTFANSPVNLTVVRADLTQNLVGTPGMHLGGRVVTPTGQPFPGIEVVVLEARHNLPPVRRTATTDAQGEWLLPNLPAALYEITPTPPQAGFTFNPTFLRFVLGGPAGNCGNYFTFRASRNAAEIVAIEAVQVIQDWQNNVPLVEGKSTLIRAFVKPTGTNQTPVPIANPILKVFRNGTLLANYRPTASPHSARADYASRRNGRDTSIPFRLETRHLSGTNTLRLEWPGGLLTTFATNGQTAVRNNETEIRFTKLNELPVRFVLVNWRSGTNSVTTPASLAETHRSRLLAGLPVAAITALSSGTRTLDWRPASDPTDPLNDADLSLSGDLLAKLKRLKRDDLADERRNIIYYGVITGTSLRSAGDISGGVACFADISPDTTARRNLPIHEMGHALGRHHAVHSAFGLQLRRGQLLKQGMCDEEALGVAPDFPMDSLGSDILAPVLGPMRLGNYRYAYGWDRIGDVYVSPFQTPDVMSYCNSRGNFTTAWVWPGVFSYIGMMDAIRDRFGPRLAPRAGAPANLPIPVLRISGVLDHEGQLVTLDPVTVAETEWTEPAPGDLMLQLRDAQGLLLDEVSFASQPLGAETLASDLRSFSSFDVEIPLPDQLAHIEIRRAGILVAHQPVSPNPPAFTDLQPSQDESVSIPAEGLNLVWTVQDPDGDILRTRVEVASEPDLLWSPIAFDLTETGFMLEPRHFHRAGIHRVRLVTSDGFHTTHAIVPTRVLVPDQPPILRIDDPALPARFSPADPIRLAASADDPEDGVLDQIQWSTDTIDELGQGTELDLEPGTLAVGVHQVTATVTDSSGQSVTETFAIEITDHLALDLTFRIVGDSVELRWPAATPGHPIQAAYDLEPDAWFTLEVEPELIDDEWVLTLPIVDDSPQFFRLQP